MGELRTSYIIDLAGNLQEKARRFESGLRRLGTGGGRSMQVLGRSLSMASRGLDRLGNRYTALLTGAAGIGSLRQVGNLEERLTQLGIQASVSDKAIAGLKRRIFDISQNSKIRIDPEQLIAATENIVEMTGDLKFAENNLKTFGYMIGATGAKTGEAVGGIAAQFQKTGLRLSSDITSVMNTLTAQGKLGSFTIQNFAKLGSRIVPAYMSMGRTGKEAYREMGAVLQAMMDGTGEAQEAVTTLEQILMTLSDAQKLKILQKHGIQVYEPGSKDVMKSLPELMDEIVKKAHGSKVALSEVFGARAIRGFNPLISQYLRTGKIDYFDKFMKIRTKDNILMEDSARAAKGFNRSLTSLYTTWKRFSDTELAGPIQSIADTLNSLKPSTMATWLKIGTVGAGALGLLVMGNKLYRTFSGLFGLFAKKSLPGAGGLGASGPIPVYVVNGQMSMLNNGTGFGMTGAAGEAEAAAGGTLAKIGGLAAKGTALIGAGALGYSIGTAINHGMGMVINALTGKKYDTGGAIGEWLYDAFHNKGGKTDIGGTLRIEIDDRRARLKSAKKNSDMFNFDVDSGIGMTGL